MQIILLSGGSGKRLWPLSDDVRSKQFLQLLPAPDGGMESMVQRVVRQLHEAGMGENITFATSESQKELLISQLGGTPHIVTEPERRNTFPAIVLSAAHLFFERGCGADEVILVMPSDPFTEAGYFETLRKVAVAVEDDVAELVLMGIRPTSPSVKYGYIVPKTGPSCGTSSADEVSDCAVSHSKSVSGSALEVSRFVEKPSETDAAGLISKGALWNGCVFAFRLRHILEVMDKYISVSSFNELLTRYGELPKNSFDYEVVEKADSVAVVPYEGMWRDLGTWDALTSELPGNSIGNAVFGGDNENTFVINELDVPLMTIGAKNLVVIASSNGILVCEKNECANIRAYVESVT